MLLLNRLHRGCRDLQALASVCLKLPRVDLRLRTMLLLLAVTEEPRRHCRAIQLNLLGHLARTFGFCHRPHFGLEDLSKFTINWLKLPPQYDSFLRNQCVCVQQQAVSCSEGHIDVPSFPQILQFIHELCTFSFSQQQK